MADEAKGSSSQKSSKRTLSLEASLDNLNNLANSIKTPKSKKSSNFFFSHDGTGKRVSSSKSYKYRSVAERSSKNRTRDGSVASSSVNDVNTDDNYEMDDIEEETFTYTNATEKLTNCIDNCEKLTSEIESRTPSIWTKRMQSVEANWESGRASILSALLKSHAIPSFESLCHLCMSRPAIIRCHHCGPTVLICHDCDESIHEKKSMHDRDVWINGFLQPISSTETVLENGSLGFTKRYVPFLMVEECVCCKQRDMLSLIPSSETCIIITCQGRYDLFLFNYQCNSCGKQFSPLKMEKIITEGYWPGSPTQLNHVFSEDVFKLWDSVRKNMPGTSETAFLRSLGILSSDKGRSSTINHNVFHRAFKEWCFAMYEIECMQGKNWIDCPSCFGCQHSCHVDGNAKLYRYSCVPRGERKCYYENLFIEPKEDVDMHLKTVYSSAISKKNSSNSYCGTSNWKAARNTSNLRTKLDETGLEVAGCRHSLALAAVNMYQGELFGYAHYLQINRLVAQGVKFLWQDVVCKYWPWFTSLPKELSPAGAFLMKPALSIMHGKAHIWSCQVTWSGRWQQGSAYSTGEEVEQINSYISRLGSTTKYMHAAGRDETLTEHILYWNKQKVLKLPKSLCKKYVQVKRLIEVNKDELEREVGEVNCANKLESGILEKWTEEIVKCGKRTQFRDIQLTKRQHDLIQYYQLNAEISEVNSLKPFVEASRDGIGVALVTGNGELLTQALSKQQDVERKQTQLDKLGSGLSVFGCDSKRASALEEGKKLLASKKRNGIREEIEMTSFSILQRTKNISRLADSSKQRSRLRSKNMSEKKRLEDLVKQHNFVNRMLEEMVSDVTLDQVLTASFPWIDSQDKNDALPLRTKRKSVEVYLTGKRLEEEIILLEEEMLRFLCYYKDKVIPALSKRLHSLEKDELSNEDVEVGTGQLDEGKYKARQFSPIALVGEKALLKRGVFFSKRMVKEAITLFKRVVEGKMDELDFSDSEGEEYDDDDHENVEEEEQEEPEAGGVAGPEKEADVE